MWPALCMSRVRKGGEGGREGGREGEREGGRGPTGTRRRRAGTDSLPPSRLHVSQG
jgi:hypothetical protein